MGKEFKICHLNHHANMAAKILPLTTVLTVKVPSGFHIQPLKDKKSVRKNILKSISKLLRKEEMQLICFGYKEEDEYELPEANYHDDSTFITINIIESRNNLFDFASSQAAILKRFKKELKENEEQILIDRTEMINGKTVRNIEVYIKSVVSEKKKPVVKNGYSFAKSLAYTG